MPLPEPEISIAHLNGLLDVATRDCFAVVAMVGGRDGLLSVLRLSVPK